MRSGRVIERLEARRLLTTVLNGTEGSDTIIIRAGGGHTTIKINNFERTYTDSTGYEINALGGNDNVYIPLMNFAPGGIAIDLGAGNDYVTNLDGVYNFGDMSSFVHFPHIDGGDGNDTLALDDSASDDGRWFTFENSSVAGRHAISVIDPGSQGTQDIAIGYDSTIENVWFEGTQDDDTFNLISKPAITKLIVNGQGGQDSFFAGTDVLKFSDASTGWLNGTTTLTGGGNNDYIQFNAKTAAGVYTFNAFTLTTGTTGFTYSAFAAQSLYAANGSAVDSIGANSGTGRTYIYTSHSAINLLYTASYAEVRGFNNTIAVGVGNLDDIHGVVQLVSDFGPSHDILYVYDQSATVSTTYILDAHHLYARNLAAPIQFTSLDQINFTGGLGDDLIAVDEVAAGEAVSINGGGGADALTLSNGDVAGTVLSPISFDGAAGSDIFFIKDGSVASSGILTSSTYTEAGIVHSYLNCESLYFTGGTSAATNLSVNSHNIPATLTGGSADDTFGFGAGMIGTNIKVNLSVDGAGGSDNINFLSQDETTNKAYQFTSTSGFRLGSTIASKVISFTNFEHGTLQCGTGDDAITVSAASIALSISAGGGNDAVSVNASSASVVVDTGDERRANSADPQGDTLSVGAAAGSPATVVVNQDDSVIGLSVSVGGTLRVNAGAVLNRLRPTTDGGLVLSGTIDLAGGAILWHALTTGMPDFRTPLARGYSAGGWNGTNALGAINSSLAAGSIDRDAVGYGLGSQIGITKIGRFNIGAGDVLLRYTLDGDADLNAAVNADDLAVLSRNWQGTNNVFSQADFDYDGKVDIRDLYSVATNWQKSYVVPTAVPVSNPAPPRPPTRTAARVISLIE